MELSTKKTAYLASFLGIALILSYVESLLPLQLWIPIPGIRLGLANLATLIVWGIFGFPSAFCVSFLRVLLQSLLFGSLTSLLLSLGGMCASLTVLFLCSKKNFGLSVLGISVLCAAAHQIGQVFVASLLFTTPALFFTYLPWLLLCSMVTGSLIGVLALRMIPLFQRF